MNPEPLCRALSPFFFFLLRLDHTKLLNVQSWLKCWILLPYPLPLGLEACTNNLAAILVLNEIILVEFHTPKPKLCEPKP